MALEQAPLWKAGKFAGMEFCGNWERLEVEEPSTFNIIKPIVGTEAKDDRFMYKVHQSPYGPSLSRKHLQVVATKMTTLDKPEESGRSESIAKMHDENVAAQDRQTAALVKLAESIEKLATTFQIQNFQDKKD